MEPNFRLFQVRYKTKSSKIVISLGCVFSKGFQDEGINIREQT